MSLADIDSAWRLLKMLDLAVGHAQAGSPRIIHASGEISAGPMRGARFTVAVSVAGGSETLLRLIDQGTKPDPETYDVEQDWLYRKDREKHFTPVRRVFTGYQNGSFEPPQEEG